MQQSGSSRAHSPATETLTWTRFSIGVWIYYIGGFQSAQKLLKDREDRALSFDDTRHYKNIIEILSKIDRIMKTTEIPLG